MVQLVRVAGTAYNPCFSELSYICSRATRVLASQGFYVSGMLCISFGSLDRTLHHRHSGIGLTPQHGILLDV